MLQQLAPSLFLLCGLYLTLANSQPSCSAVDEELMKQKRIQALRANILAQLGLTEPPPIPETPVVVPPAVLENFRVVSQMTTLMEQEKGKQCNSQEFYAHPITSFVGRINADMDDRAEKRSVGVSTSDHDQSKLLNHYTLSFDFELAKNLSSITQGSLVLFQNPAPKLDSYVRDTQQYVEVKSIASNSTQVPISSVMAGKLLGIYEGGFQVFDITSTLNLWTMMGIKGNVDIEVSVYCIQSADCAQPDSLGRKPQSVEFVHDHSDANTAPRLVISSKSPLSITSESRVKRQAGGASFCVGNQSTCCLKEFFINFQEDLGPDFAFIVDPVSYQANYCEGLCPTSAGGELVTPLLYEFISKLQNNPLSSLEPCCAGHVYEDLNVLLDLEGMLFAATLENVSVTSCRCF